MAIEHEKALLELAAHMRGVAEAIRQEGAPGGGFQRTVRSDSAPLRYDERLHVLHGELLRIADAIEKRSPVK